MSASKVESSQSSGMVGLVTLEDYDRAVVEKKAKEAAARLTSASLISSSSSKSDGTKSSVDAKSEKRKRAILSFADDDDAEVGGGGGARGEDDDAPSVVGKRRAISNNTSGPKSGNVLSSGTSSTSSSVSGKTESLLKPPSPLEITAASVGSGSGSGIGTSPHSESPSGSTPSSSSVVPPSSSSSSSSSSSEGATAPPASKRSALEAIAAAAASNLTSTSSAAASSNSSSSSPSSVSASSLKRDGITGITRDGVTVATVSSTASGITTSSSNSSSSSTAPSHLLHHQQHSNPDIHLPASSLARAHTAEGQRLREKLKAEWVAAQELVKKEKIEVVYSWWDGSGHRRVIVVPKGATIGRFLEWVRQDLQTEFPPLRFLSGDDLLFVKEDLLIPHAISFYDLIVAKARGKSGPLFSFGVKDDTRLVTDARVEKEDSHPGKIVERRWYEKNKHLFPASRWEAFDFAKQREGPYTIHGGEVQTKK